MKLKPRMFIGSSVEQLPLAKAIQSNLQHTIRTTIWTQGFFMPGKSALDSLQEQGGKFDFGLFIFKPDDVLKLRNKSYKAVRDNVLFELGLFMGLLGKERNFCLAPAGSGPDLRIASDLIGFTPLTFDDDPNEPNKMSLLGSACSELERVIDNIWFESFLAGDWFQQWSVKNSKNFKKVNSSKATVCHIGNKFRTVIESKTQRYEIEGIVERGQFITGRWTDVLKGASYFGSFQLSVCPMHKILTGKWLGFRSNNKIQSGDWVWTRIKKAV